MVLKVGDNAPDFTLQSDGGKKVSMKDYREEKLFFTFIRKTALRDALKRRGDSGIWLKSLAERMPLSSA